MIRATINGKSCEFKDSRTILEAARSLGIEVPTLCHDERLKPAGACRLCVLEVEGWPHPAVSCHTPLTNGMVIQTETEALGAERRGVLSLLAHRYPREAIQQGLDKTFHRYLHHYGLVDEVLGDTDPELVDDSHPYIHVDMNRCIYCYRCVRICEELQGQFVWQIWNRGAETRIVPDSGTNLRESSCVSCGACVDTCPTGALEDKSVIALGTPTRWTKTTCAYCGTGCEMKVGTASFSSPPPSGHGRRARSNRRCWCRARCGRIFARDNFLHWWRGRSRAGRCHSESFPIGKKAALRSIGYEPTIEIANKEFPFLLTTGRTLYQFNAGTMTLRTRNTDLHRTDYLDISPADCEKLKLLDGEKVRLCSAHGEALLAVRINTALKAGTLFATFHTAEVFLNNLTSPYRDKYTLTPEYKVTAVRIEKL